MVQYESLMFEVKKCYQTEQKLVENAKISKCDIFENFSNIVIRIGSVRDISFVYLK